ncbi:unnamed protein product, partial [Brenthis ino]
MSSLSSIENEKEIFYNSFRVNEAYPWYPTLGQPLIYYSEVEHFPNSRTDKVDIKDFATWLDEKYNDYLQNSHTQYNYNETSTIEIVASSNKVKKKEIKSKKQSRLRSSHSIEVILKPKQLTRPASECCQKSIAQSRNQINSTTQSNTSVVEKKLKPKSQSLTSILKEREIYVIPFDIVQDAKNDIEGKKKSAIIISKRDSAMKYKKNNIKDIMCQCSYVMSNRADASSQFEKKTSKPNICLCNDVEPTALRKGEKIGYPIFMKLICPDKMKENYFLKTQT